jgi:hypothetical protein
MGYGYMRTEILVSRSLLIARLAPIDGRMID